ncbi:hypothetical protein R3P38DRAFT_2758918 [Favolaschia claudopus]|uniref:Uncharacterized protein n=1 Tax=Favolaschia claudopus TaxID=2862362 RepID=A0AAW0E672_9AGAR
MSAKHYDCSCALRPNPHRIHAKEWSKHLRDKRALENRVSTQPTPTPPAREVQNAEEPNGVNLENSLQTDYARQASEDLSALMNKMAIDDTEPSVSASKDLTIGQAADLTIASFLTDDTPTSLSSSNQPAEMDPLPQLAQATRSVHNLIADARARAKPVGAVQQRRADVLLAIFEKLGAAEADLVVTETFDTEDKEKVAEMHRKLDAAVETSLLVEKSLARLPDSAEKQEIIGRLKAFDSTINVIGSVIPPRTTPFPYDAISLLKS